MSSSAFIGPPPTAHAAALMNRVFDFHRERQPMLDLDGEDYSVAEVGDGAKHFSRLILQQKVFMSKRWKRGILRADLQSSDYSRRRIENRVTPTNLKALDPTESKPLHQLNQLTRRLGKRGFGECGPSFNCVFVSAAHDPIERGVSTVNTQSSVHEPVGIAISVLDEGHQERAKPVLIARKCLLLLAQAGFAPLSLTAEASIY
jgi:hypothetical protein